MQLTPNFAKDEFEKDGPMPDECIPMYTVLAHTLLEVIRAQFKVPLIITSGYRSPSANLIAHGAVHSQHVATAEYCAADFRAVIPVKTIFDWIRQQTNLVWDQVILEHDPNGNDIIHLSATRGLNRRQALEGETENLSAYVSCPVAAFSTLA